MKKVKLDLIVVGVTGSTKSTVLEICKTALLKRGYTISDTPSIGSSIESISLTKMLRG